MVIGLYLLNGPRPALDELEKRLKSGKDRTDDAEKEFRSFGRRLIARMERDGHKLPGQRIAALQRLMLQHKPR